VLLALPLALVELPGPEAPPAVALTTRSVAFAMTGLVVVTFAYFKGELFTAFAGLRLGVPIFALVSRIRHWRHRTLDPGRLRHPLRRDARAHGLQCLNHWLFWLLLALTILPGTYALFRLSLSLNGYHLLLGALCAGALLMLLIALVPARRVFLPGNLLILAGSLFLAWQLLSIYRAPANPVTLDLPFNEQMYVVHGGRSSLINAHNLHGFEHDALDIVRVVDGRSQRGDDHNLTTYYAYGVTLLAPADGVVTQVVSDLPEQAIGKTDADHPAGDFVIIDIGNGRYVMLAHMQPGSARVAVGDQVRVRQALGLLGNSGNTSEPHVHIQVQNQPTFDIDHTDGLRTYPILFRGARLVRDETAKTPTAADVRRGDRIGPSD